MPDTSKILRIDPAPSKALSWLEWQEFAPVLLDVATGHVLRPASPTLHVRYRTTGAEWDFWPVSETEVHAVFSPGPQYDFSIGRAFNDLIKSHKSSRQVKSGERQETKRQRGVAEQRVGRRWLA